MYRGLYILFILYVCCLTTINLEKTDKKKDTKKSKYSQEYKSPSKIIASDGVFFEYVGSLKHNLNKYDLILKVPFIKPYNLTLRPVTFNFCNVSRNKRWHLESVCQNYLEMVQDLNRYINQSNYELERLLIHRVYEILPTYFGEEILNSISTPFKYNVKKIRHTRETRIPPVDLDKWENMPGKTMDGFMDFIGFVPVVSGVSDLYNERRVHKRIDDVINEIIANREGIIVLKNYTMVFAKKINTRIDEMQDYMKKLIDNHNLMIRDLQTVRSTLVSMQNMFLAHDDMLVMLSKADKFMLRVLLNILDWYGEANSIALQFIDGINDIGTGFLSHNLVPVNQLIDILDEVESTLEVQLPSYKLLHTKIKDYYGMPNIIHVLTKIGLVIMVPMYLEHKEQKSLKLFKIHSTAVPGAQTDKGTTLYAKHNELGEYLAIGKDHHVILSEQDIKRCVLYRNDFLCTHIMFMRTNEDPVCEYLIFNQDKRKEEKCKLTILHPKEPPHPIIFDADSSILVAHTKGPWTIVYDGKIKAPKEVKGSSYALIEREQLCKKSLAIGNIFIPGTLYHCAEVNLQITRTLNNAFTQKLEPLFTLEAYHPEENRTLSFDIPPIKILEPIPGMSYDKSLEINKLIEQLKNEDGVYFDEEYLEKLKTNRNKWKHPHSIMIYVIVVVVVVVIIIIACLVKNHRKLKNSAVSYITTAAGFPTMAKAEIAEMMEIIPTETIIHEKNPFQVILVWVLLILIVVIIIYFLRSQYKRYVKMTSYIRLQLSSVDYTMTLPLKNIEALPLDIIQSGKIALNQFRYERKCYRDIIYIAWGSLKLKNRDKQISVPNFIEIPWYKKYWTRRIMSQDLIEVKVILVYHNYFYAVKTLTEVTRSFMEELQSPQRQSIYHAALLDSLNDSPI